MADTETIIDSSTITNNGAGAASGIEIFLDGTPAAPTNMVTVTGNIIDGNGVNISSTVTDVGAMLTTVISANTSISNANNNGISIQSLRGATHLIDISDNPMIMGNGFATGTQIRLVVDDEPSIGFGMGVGPLTTMTGMVMNNSITNSNGTADDPDITPPIPVDPTTGTASIGIFVEGNSFFDATFDTNTIENGPDGAAFLAEFNVTNMMVNAINLLNNTLNGLNQVTGIDVGDEIVFIRSREMTHLDLVVRNNTFTDAPDEAFELLGFDTTLTRMLFEDNTIIDNSMMGMNVDSPISQHGVEVVADDNAEMLLTLRANMIQSVGGDGELVETGVTIANPDWGEGIDISSRRMADIATRIINNNIEGSALEAVRLETVAGTSNLDALVLDNSFDDNDRAMADDGMGGILEMAGEQDFHAEQITGTMCVALDNNFAGTGIGFLVEGGGARLEDGTNFPTATTGAGIVVTPFNPTMSTCITNIVAQELAFSAAGFP